ncbi:MAG: SRPBCC domain-containing protein [Frankiaceae bacterium]|nr:SRPBCC domain-containing protein [Frankiaceae bacterium]
MTVDIAAPAAFVWEVLLDYPRYPEWNPYTVRVESTCLLGDPVDLYLPDPLKPGELMHQREWICLVDAPRQFAYEMHPTPELDVHARRDQYVEETGPEACRYWTTDVFSGPLADLVMEHSGAWVKEGFDAVAHALKSRCESLAG